MRILMVSGRLPYPVIGGEFLRIYNLLERIARSHEVWLTSFVETPEQVAGIDHLKSICAGVETVDFRQRGALERPLELISYALHGIPVDLRLLESEMLRQKIRDLTTRMTFDVVQIENSFMALYLEALPPTLRGKSLLMLIDVGFQKYDRIWRVETRPARKMRLWLRSRMLRRWEPDFAESFGRCATVSEADRQLMLAENPRLTIDVVPNGVDTRANAMLPEDGSATNLVFVGSMNYPPNADGAVWFCREVLPHIRRVVPAVEMWIVGTHPTPEVQRLEGDGIHVTGRVEDVRPYYRTSTVSVVPLRAGGGTRLKILESMALGRPVVTTSIGCEGLDAVDGEHLVIADTPQQFAAKTAHLLTNGESRRQLAANARALVETRYDWDVIAGQLMQIYQAMNG